MTVVQPDLPKPAGQTRIVDDNGVTFGTQSNPFQTNATSAFSDTSTSGTVTNNNDAVTIVLPGGQSTALIQITGTFVGTLNFEASPDSGTTYYSVQASVVGGSTLATTTTSTGAWRCNISGFTNFRVRLSPATSGTATIGIRLSAGVHNVFINNASALGQTTMANSAPVVLASDEIVPASRTNKEVSFSTTSAQVVASTDAALYPWVSVQITSQGTSSTISFQMSNDNTTWLTVPLMPVTNATGGGIATSTTTTGGYHGPMMMRYFRLNVTGISAGTTAGLVEFFSVPAAMQATPASSSQNGTWTVQPGNTQNTTPWLVNTPSSDVTIFASGAQTTTQTQADQTNNTARGIKVVLDMTNVASSPSVTLEIDGKDVASGKYYSILTGAAVTTASTNVYMIYPGLTASANVAANDVLPHTWRVKVTANNANSGTYSVGASLLP